MSGGLPSCPVCTAEQQSKTMFERHECPLPCPVHGDPRDIFYVNEQALEIYGRLPKQQIQTKDGKLMMDTIIDIPYINILCQPDWFDISDKLSLLDRLHVIQGVIQDGND